MTNAVPRIFHDSIYVTTKINLSQYMHNTSIFKMNLIQKVFCAILLNCFACSNINAQSDDTLHIEMHTTKGTDPIITLDGKTYKPEDRLPKGTSFNKVRVKEELKLSAKVWHKVLYNEKIIFNQQLSYFSTSEPNSITLLAGDSITIKVSDKICAVFRAVSDTVPTLTADTLSFTLLTKDISFKSDTDTIKVKVLVKGKSTNFAKDYRIFIGSDTISPTNTNDTLTFPLTRQITDKGRELSASYDFQDNHIERQEIGTLNVINPLTINPYIIIALALVITFILIYVWFRKNYKKIPFKDNKCIYIQKCHTIQINSDTSDSCKPNLKNGDIIYFASAGNYTLENSKITYRLTKTKKFPPFSCEVSLYHQIPDSSSKAEQKLYINLSEDLKEGPNIPISVEESKELYIQKGDDILNIANGEFIIDETYSIEIKNNKVSEIYYKITDNSTYQLYKVALNDKEPKVGDKVIDCGKVKHIETGQKTYEIHNGKIKKITDVTISNPKHEKERTLQDESTLDTVLNSKIEEFQQLFENNKKLTEENKQLFIEEFKKLSENNQQLIIEEFKKLSENNQQLIKEKETLNNENKILSNEKEQLLNEKTTLSLDIEKLKKDKDITTTKLSDLQKSYKTDLDKAKETIYEEANSKIDKIKSDSEKKVNKAKKAQQDAESETKTIKEKVTQEYKGQIDKLTVEKEEAIQNYNRTKNSLSEREATLKETKTDLSIANQKIVSLENAQKQYTSVLSHVPFAVSHTQKIYVLIENVDSLLSSAIKLLDVKTVDDDYHILKAIAKYRKRISAINMAQFLTEINMITKGQMVIKDSPISSYANTKNSKQAEEAVKTYFFDNYLASYIEAAIILNETCAALDKIVEGLPHDEVTKFTHYRTIINNTVEELGIIAECPKLFDNVGQKVDLWVQLIDAGFSTGDILEIENCIIYQRGTRKPNTKILVKAQS